jgi:hypothetical protein
VSPIPALAVAALLGSSGRLRTASAFVAGEALTIGAIAALVVVLAADSAESAVESALAFLQLGVGILLALLFLAHRRAARREPASSRMLPALD